MSNRNLPGTNRTSNRIESNEPSLRSDPNQRADRRSHRVVWRTFAGPVLIVVALAMVGCNGNLSSGDPPPLPPPEQGSGQSTPLGDQTQPSAVPTAFYPDSSGPTPTLGEQLGRLDAMMKRAPADSLPILQAEYRRLLNDTSFTPPVRTGGTPIPNSTADTSGVVVAEPRRPAEPIDEDLTWHPGLGNASAPEFPLVSTRGLRPSEIRTIPGNRLRVATLTEPRQARAVDRGSTSRTSARTQYRDEPYEAYQPQGDNRKELERKTVDGIAAARSGRYSEAAEQLQAPAGGSKRSNSRTGYYYALSLEKSGKLAEASREYLRASRAGGALAERSYLEHCRLVAQLGQRERARSLVLQFIRRNPDSSQVVNARQLLQTM